MSTSESRFSDRLVELTGANVSKIAALRGTAPDAHAAPATTDEPLAKIATMSLAEIVDDPTFVAAFTARVEERRPEIDAAFAECEIG